MIKHKASDLNEQARKHWNAKGNQSNFKASDLYEQSRKNWNARGNSNVKHLAHQSKREKIGMRGEMKATLKSQNAS